MRIKKITIAGLLGMVIMALTAPGINAQENNQIDSWLAAGVQQYNAGQFQQASEYFSAVLQQIPDHAYANYYLGAIFFKINKADKAIIYLEKAAAAEPKIEGVDAFLANVYLQANMPEKALPYYRQKYESDPGNEDVALQYGKMLKEIGQEDEAIAVLQKIVDGGGIQVNGARYYQGAIQSSRGMYGTAVGLFQQVDPASAYGDAAKQYIDALKATTRPFNVYLALDYFYNDNPESDAIELVPGQIFTGGAKGSQGVNQILSINSRSLEMGENWKARIGYLYYGISYLQDFAEQYDYAGHYIKPHIEYVISKNRKINFDFKYSIIDYNDQDLNDSYSLDVQYYRKLDDGDEFYLVAGAQVDRYTDSFKSTPLSLPSSMEYKDAVIYKAGAGVVFHGPQQAGTVTLTGTYKECFPDNEDDVLLAARSRDYRFREGIFGAELMVPLERKFKGLTFTGTFNFSYRDHLNIQTGDLYNSAIGKDIDVVGLTFGAKLSYLLNKKYGLRLAGGIERNENESQADELNTVSNKYYIQIAGSY